MAHGMTAVLSAILDVEFMGFRSSTAQLQHAGWEFMAQEDPARMAVRVSFKSPRHGLVMIGEWLDFERISGRFLKTHYMPIQHERPCVRVSQVLHECTQVFVRTMETSWTPVDMRPTVDSDFEFDFDRLTSLFRPIAVPEEKEIIVGPQNVDEALKLILAMQAPGQAELRERNRSQARRVHAQVVSLAA